MKIRKGFVSNSSSSSFCAYCAEIDKDDLIKIADAIDCDLSGIDLDECEEDELIDEVSSALKDTQYKFDVFVDGPGYTSYIGRYISSINDDETYGDFKRSITEPVEKLIGARSFYLEEEGWWNG